VVLPSGRTLPAANGLTPPASRQRAGRGSPPDIGWLAWDPGPGGLSPPFAAGATTEDLRIRSEGGGCGAKPARRYRAGARPGQDHRPAGPGNQL